MQVLPPNPVSGAIKGGSKPSGGSALPPNPVSASLALRGAPVASQAAAPPKHALAPGSLEQLNAETIKASAPVVADYNKTSKGTQGIVPGFSAKDLAEARAAGKKNPEQAALYGSLADPTQWVKGAIESAPQVVHGVGKALHGNVSGGAKQAGMGALGVASVLPFGKGAGLLGDAVRTARTAEEADAHLAPLMAQAKAEGWGAHAGSKDHAPFVDEGSHTPETGGELGQQVREALVGKGGRPAAPTVVHAPVSELVKIAQVNLGHKLHFVKGGLRENLESDISTAGKVHTPIEVAYDPTTGESAILDGHHRIAAAAKHGLETIPVKVMPIDKWYQTLSAPKKIVSSDRLRGVFDTATPLNDPSFGRSAAEIRGVQKGDMSAERAQRVEEAQLASEKAGGGTEGHLAAKAVMKGAYGRGAFPHLQHLTTEDVHALNQHIDKAPLQFFEKMTAKDAVLNAVDHGVAPTEGEQKLLERVFGKVGTDAASAKTPLGERLVSLLNVPRALRSSADLSMPFRQNLVTLVTHPRAFASSFGKSARMLVDPAYHRAIMDEIHNDPIYPLLQKFSNGKLFTEIGDGSSVLKHEEAFIGGNVAERLNIRELPGPLKGKKYATGPGDIVRASDRAFSGGLNYSRYLVGKQLVEKAALMGHDLSDPKVGESIAKLLGTITGRGVVPKALESHLKSLNVLFFAPRLIAARLNLLSPVYYKKLDPFARGEALRAARNMVATMGAVMVAAKMAGAQVEFDPRSSNFGKIRVGNTRIDITGGFNQYIRTIAQEMTRETITSNGSHQHITTPFLEKPSGPGQTSDIGNLWKQTRSKAAPIPGTLLDIGSGSNFIGQKTTLLGELGQNTPFIAQDIYDTKKSGASPSRLAAAAFLSAIGFGVQSYKDTPPAGSTGNQTTGGGDGYWDGGTSSGGQGYWGP